MSGTRSALRIVWVPGLALLLSGGSAGLASAAPSAAAPAAPAPGAPVPAAPVPAAPAPGVPSQAGAFGQDVIHPGDQIAITVYGEPTLSQTVTVLPDGSVNYPLVGRVSFANQNPAQASATLQQALTKYIKHPSVSIGVVKEGELTVMVLGNVKTPGKYQIPFASDVTDAIAAAGGLGPINGPYPMARITNANGIREANLQDILRNGNVSADVKLGNNAIVYVPSPITFDVQVIGAVDHPGTVSINEGDHLSAAIAKAGNSAGANADLNAIKVTRLGPDGKPKTFSINLYQELEKGDMKADIPLQKNDVVYVPQAKKNQTGNYSGGILSILGHVFGVW